jgi:hypothetical protein
MLWKLTYAYPRLVRVTASRQTLILATGPIPLNNSKSMASVTLGSSSPTYNEADGEVPEVPAAGAPVAAAAASSPDGEGDSLGEGTELESPLDSEGADSTEGATTGFSSVVGAAAGEAVSAVLAVVVDIMNGAWIG